MSMQALRSYMRTQLATVKAGNQPLREWTDGFNWDNIPDTVLNGSYHLEPPIQTQVSLPAGGDAVQWRATQSVIVIFEGYKSTAQAIDDAIKCQESAIQAVMNKSIRFVQAFKDVKFKGAKIAKVNPTNNTSAKLQMDFEADVYLDI